MKKQNSKQNASTTRDFQVMIPNYDFRRPAESLRKKIEIETDIIQSNQSKNQRIIVQNSVGEFSFRNKSTF